MAERFTHDEMMGWDKAARWVKWPALADEGFVPPSAEESAEVVRELVWEVQRLRQVIAIRHEADRRAEQIEKGFR